LPEFTGHEGAAEEMARRYARFSEMLAPLGEGIAHLSLSSRHAWQMQLKDGLVVELGREQMEERLARFTAAYPQFKAAQKSPGKYVDLRYRNGFAAGAAAG
jgi:cell division protein FtsQ